VAKKRILTDDDRAYLEECANCKVSYREKQALTDEQKKIARENIGVPEGGWMTEDEVQAAVEEALAQSKASGEFDGKDGKDGQDGYTPVKGKDYFDGEDGKDGYTPVKGVDYFDGKDGKNGEPYTLTEEDKQTIVDAVKEEIPEPVVRETDPSVYDFAKKELFDKADLQDPAGRNSFVTVDGVEYYRYHASSNNFVWENPSPKVGSVTITARLVSQYAPETVDTSRLIVHYSDGTTEQFWAMKAEPQTFVTNAAKTFVKLTGNYDMENWVLMDLSVMSMEASYFKGLPNALTFTGAVSGTFDGSKPMTVNIPEGGGGGSASGDYIPVPATASVGQTIKVSAVDESGKPTAWEAVDFPEGGGGAAEEWELLFDVEIAEEVKTIDTGFWAIPQKKILIILDTPAASANTTYTGVTVYTGDATWNRIIKFYAAPVPTTAANRSVICAETLGEGRVKVEQSVAPAYTGKGAIYWIQTQDCAVKSSIWNPIDGYGNAINDHITGVNVNTYGTFAVGAKIEVYGVRA
jgi:hypothetical protein